MADSDGLDALSQQVAAAVMAMTTANAATQEALRRLERAVMLEFGRLRQDLGLEDDVPPVLDMGEDPPTNVIPFPVVKR